MAAITTLRTTIANALVDNTKYSVFAFPPATPIVNSVVVAPASGDYLSPSNNQWATIAPMANLELRLYVPLLDNQGNLSGIEDMMVAVFNKLAASTIKFNVGSVTNVGSIETAAGDFLTATINISTLTEWT
jgi:hypothetical protein